MKKEIYKNPFFKAPGNGLSLGYLLFAGSYRKA